MKARWWALGILALLFLPIWPRSERQITAAQITLLRYRDAIVRGYQLRNQRPVDPFGAIGAECDWVADGNVSECWQAAATIASRVYGLTQWPSSAVPYGVERVAFDDDAVCIAMSRAYDVVRASPAT